MSLRPLRPHWWFRLVLALAAGVVAVSAAESGPQPRQLIEAAPTGEPVDQATLERIYREVRTPFKYGVILKGENGNAVDCPAVFRHGNKWTGPDLVAPSEPWDKQYAHKPWVIKHADVVYHFYCAVGDQGRVIALATSKDRR